MYHIDYNSYRAIASFNRRVRFLVIHYTAVDFTQSVASLTGPNVSAHYLIPDPADQSYTAAGFDQLRIFNLVDENERAWHAGVSAWAGRDNLNDTAIGIEIVNQATETNEVFTFPPFHPLQIAALKQLVTNILQRYPDILATHVVGHSDIAPGRKTDPGAAFPWEELYASGIGAWYDPQTKAKYVEQFTTQCPEPQAVIEQLNRYGYDTSNTESDIGFRQLVRAFQLHFRPCNYSGQLDVETAAIVYALVEKYKA